MAKFRLFGLIGYPLGHSFSQRYFANKFEQEGTNAKYNKFEIQSIDALNDILDSNPDLAGLNVTLPHKEAVLPFLTDINEEAKAIGAVNVIKISQDENGQRQLVGYNSDYYGFSNSIRPLLSPDVHTKALVLGVGGASKAIVYGLRKLGLEVQLVSRRKTENTIVYEELNEDIMREYTVIVNCTPLGTFPNVEEAVNIPYQYLSPRHLLYDVVYNPEVTTFLRRGQEAGAQIKNGAEMLELQAIRSWEIWNQ